MQGVSEVTPLTVNLMILMPAAPTVPATVHGFETQFHPASVIISRYRRRQCSR